MPEVLKRIQKTSSCLSRASLQIHRLETALREFNEPKYMSRDYTGVHLRMEEVLHHCIYLVSHKNYNTTSFLGGAKSPPSTVVWEVGATQDPLSILSQR